MKFKVGDLVKIKDWDDMVCQYGLDPTSQHIETNFTFIDEMKPLCGIEFRITQVINQFGFQQIKGDNEVVNYFLISDDMLELVDIDNDENLSSSDELEEFLKGWECLEE